MTVIREQTIKQFDVIVITASNEHQAELCRKQLALRTLPAGTEFTVLPDPEGARVGSGGATLAVIRCLMQKYGSFQGLRAACIHSGGDGQRVPAYSALGKLFSPLPHTFPDGRPDTMFDELMAFLLSAAEGLPEGLMLLAGDILLRSDPKHFHCPEDGASALSFLADEEKGKNHGVFLPGAEGRVRKFLHKRDVGTLRREEASDRKGQVHIDTGTVFFTRPVCEALYGLIRDEDGFRRFVNPKARLSLYADFLFPMAQESTFLEYCMETPEAGYTKELLACRNILWEVLHPFRLHLVTAKEAEFLHFGTTGEVIRFMTEKAPAHPEEGWERENCACLEGTAGAHTAAYLSILEKDASCGDGCYLEFSRVLAGTRIGNGCYLSAVTVSGKTIPDGTVLHCLKLMDGRFAVRIYGVQDDPKKERLFGCSLTDFSERFGLDAGVLWAKGDRTLLDTEDRTLWNAKLYPVCETEAEAVDKALELYQLVKGEASPEGGLRGECTSLLERWQQWERCSLSDGFHYADSGALAGKIREMTELVPLQRLLQGIRQRRSCGTLKYLFPEKKLTKTQEVRLQELLRQGSFSERVRLYVYLGDLLEDERYTERGLHEILDALTQQLAGMSLYDDTLKIRKERAEAALPLRINLGGAWTDTPPYCMENGGSVLNAAILVNGRYPVQAYVRRIRRPEIRLIFPEAGVSRSFTDLKELQRTGDPEDPFGLGKAVLSASGILPLAGGDLHQILKRLGGGFELCGEVLGIPKGSGLGTSSILSAACLKVLMDFTGCGYDDDLLMERVLWMEQLMAAGGGWQDQAGGIVKGIKLIRSAPGLRQKLMIEPLCLSEKTAEELSKRLILIHSGQTRPARNMVREVILRYLRNEPDSLSAYQKLGGIGERMKEALLREDVEGFAHLMEENRQAYDGLGKQIQNGRLCEIFASIKDLSEGMLPVGAGGGGFLIAVLKKGVTSACVDTRLRTCFPGLGVRVWSMTLL